MSKADSEGEKNPDRFPSPYCIRKENTGICCVPEDF